MLSLKRVAWSSRVLPGNVVVSGQHQTTNMLNCLHAGLELRPLVTSFTCCFALFPSSQDLMTSLTWTCPLSLRNKVFRWSAECAVLVPPFTPLVHLS